MSRHIIVYGQSLLKCHKRAVAINLQFHLPLIVVQSLSYVWLFETPWTTAHQASRSFTISWILLKLISIESVMPSNHLILCRPLLLQPSIFPSIKVFFNELALLVLLSGPKFLPLWDPGHSGQVLWRWSGLPPSCADYAGFLPLAWLTNAPSLTTCWGLAPSWKCASCSNLWLCLVAGCLFPFSLIGVFNVYFHQVLAIEWFKWQESFYAASPTY